jgi:carbohydrate kinase (thermoresistant glucokinase family)
MTIVVVMGVSGCGKTTVGEAIAAALNWRFQEGDALHPPANVVKMAGGTPLTDEDRWPWLAAIANAMAGWRADHASGVVTCSALKRRYRDALRDGLTDVRILHLAGSRDLIATRLATRRGHFMPATLLDSQFAALEPPGPEEAALTLDVGLAPEMIVAKAVAWLTE